MAMCAGARLGVGALVGCFARLGQRLAQALLAADGSRLHRLAADLVHAEGLERVLLARLLAAADEDLHRLTARHLHGVFKVAVCTVHRDAHAGGQVLVLQLVGARGVLGVDEAADEQRVADG